MSSEASPSAIPAPVRGATGPRPIDATTVPDLGRLRIDRNAARPRGRNGLLVVLLLAVLGFVGWAYATGRLDLATGSGGIEVTTTTVLAPGSQTGSNASAGAIAGEVTGNGYVIARRRAALSTVLSGRLVELSVEEGSHVKAGQAVARIQHDDVDAALATAKKDTAILHKKRAELEQSLAASHLDLERLRADNRVLGELVTQAQAEADRTAADVERNRSLAEAHVIEGAKWDAIVAAAKAAAAALQASKAKVAAGTTAEAAWSGEIARREAALGTSDAEIARAEVAERQAEILVEKTFVRAPWDGLVVHKDAEVGEVVAATGAGGNSRGSVATIVDPATLEVQVELSETRLGTIGEGDLTRIALDAAPEVSYRGRVRQVWPTADRQKATVEMRVEFLDRPPVLKPEMGARVTFLAKGSALAKSGAGMDGAGDDKPVVSRKPRVDAAAIVAAEGKQFVYLVVGGKVRRVEVTTGATSSGRVDVESGLVGGEIVVLSPPAGLRDGDDVKTISSKESR